MTTITNDAKLHSIHVFGIEEEGVREKNRTALPRSPSYVANLYKLGL